MPETFLILLTGGVLLATGACDPRVVPLRWLRLSGVVALVLAGVAIGFAAFVRDVPAAGSVVVQRVQVGLITMTVALALGHVAAVPVAMVRAQRWVAVAGFAVAVLAGSHLLHASMAARGTSLYPGSKALAMALQTFACAGAAALPGLVVMA
ncbi:MAG TPA: hypothetical protein VK324_03310, partial [Tepidisphaeraceae bacterium]|nr:hypothetical protein [Tepidisphaeraceae bacterium]